MPLSASGEDNSSKLPEGHAHCGDVQPNCFRPGDDLRRQLQSDIAWGCLSLSHAQVCAIALDAIALIVVRCCRFLEASLSNATGETLYAIRLGSRNHAGMKIHIPFRTLR
jgi:hypothetical protein